MKWYSELIYENFIKYKLFSSYNSSILMSIGKLKILTILVFGLFFIGIIYSVHGFNKKKKTKARKTKNILNRMQLGTETNEFQRSIMVGYNEEEINEFLEKLYGDVQDIYYENHILEAKFLSLRSEAKSKGLMSDVLEKTLVSVQRTSKEMVEKAEIDAKKIVENALVEYHSKLDQAEKELETNQKIAKDISKGTEIKVSKTLEKAQERYDKIMTEAKKALDLAKTSAKEVIELSNIQVRNVIEEANEKCETIMKSGKIEALNINEEYRQLSDKLKKHKKEYLDILINQMELIEDFEGTKETEENRYGVQEELGEINYLNGTNDDISINISNTVKLEKNIK